MSRRSHGCPQLSGLDSGRPVGREIPHQKGPGQRAKVLDNDHFGLEKVKERIVEYLAVQQRSAKADGTRSCAWSALRAWVKRRWASRCQGDGARVHSHLAWRRARRSEIRGHRRTYIGSMPGKIIQALKKAKTRTR